MFGMRPRLDDRFDQLANRRTDAPTSDDQLRRRPL